jgi:predicted nucleic acid-binding protein
MNNILIDTNLLIYAIDEDSKYYNSVHMILDDVSNNLFTTSKNISEFISIITRYPGKSISIKDALIVIKEFKSIFTVLYPSEKSNLIFIDLLKKYSPHELKIHDYEIISIAL